MIDQSSTPSEKIALFRSLFRGRSDVYSRHFQNKTTQHSGYALACNNEWLRNICQKPKIKCTDCANQKFIPLSDEIIFWHLNGIDNKGREFIVAIYPMLIDETCYFLVVDFDKLNWKLDALAFLKTCHQCAVAKLH